MHICETPTIKSRDFFGKRIVHLTFDTQRNCAEYMMRIAEFYESPFPSIRGQYFTKAKYLKLYRSTDEFKKNRIQYRDAWSGFNVPMSVYIDFINTFVGDFSPEEIEIEGYVGVYADKTERDRKERYIVATYDGDYLTLDHEMSHAYWTVDEDYQMKMRRLIAKTDNDLFHFMIKKLRKMGYAKGDIILDEYAAYLATSPMPYLVKNFGPKIKKHWDEIYKWQKFFYDYHGAVMERK